MGLSLPEAKRTPIVGDHHSPQTRAIESFSFITDLVKKRSKDKAMSESVIVQLLLSRSIRHLVSWEDEDLFVHSTSMFMKPARCCPLVQDGLRDAAY